MIIAQLTDLHIGFDGKDAVCQNTARLEHVFDSLKAMRRQPDLMLLTGDLVEMGADWAYKRLKRLLDESQIPYYPAMGNHDNREAFKQVFSDAYFNEGFVQYSLDERPLRIIVLDTLEEGRHGGSFCERRANWLSKELSKAPDTPTLLALHHPPIASGIGWMTAQDDAAWVLRLKDVVSAHKQIVQIIGGHIHRTIFKAFAHTHVTVSSAVAPQVALELAPIDPNVPDDRPLITQADAGFCLHHWDGRSLTTHSANAPDSLALLRFDEAHAEVVSHTLDLS